MKLSDDNKANGGAVKAFGKACLHSCQKVLARITAAREAILTESSRAFNAPEQLLRLALNEAEAIAWQTNYPHLIFPTLATEKIQEVTRWSRKQQIMRGANPALAAAA